MSGRDWRSLDCKVYVGGLSDHASKNELETAFSRFGPLRNVWVARNPPGFAFVEFEDQRDAQDAVRALDGTRLCGVRARVELSNGRSGRGGGRGGGGRGGYGDRSGGGGGGRDYGRGRDGYGRDDRKRYTRSRSRSRSGDRFRGGERERRVDNGRGRSRSRSYS